MRVKINGPQKVRGAIEAPSSKAYTHRALVTSLLANGSSTIEKPLICGDTIRTLEAIQALGANISRNNASIMIGGNVHSSPKESRIDCGESGATLRFLTAVAATFPAVTTIIIHGPLAERPLRPLLTALKILGASTHLRQGESEVEIQVQGPLRGGSASIPGDISSQFVSGLLLAAPMAMKDVEIQIISSLESRPYVDMTIGVMRSHGVQVEKNGNSFLVPAPQTYAPANHITPTDFSSAAFMLVAGVTTGDELELSKVRESPLEPDHVMLEILAGIGARIEKKGDSIKTFRSELKSMRLDAIDHPDLVPALEVLACQAKGRSEIKGVSRLAYKESDRLRSIPEELSKMGAKITSAHDTVVIHGGEPLVGANLRSHQDHRVAMACTTASIAARGTTTIEQAEVVSKSYPGFYDDLSRIGVSLIVE